MFCYFQNPLYFLFSIFSFLSFKASSINHYIFSFALFNFSFSPSSLTSYHNLFSCVTKRIWVSISLLDTFSTLHFNQLSKTSIVLLSSKWAPGCYLYIIPSIFTAQNYDKIKSANGGVVKRWSFLFPKVV